MSANNVRMMTKLKNTFFKFYYLFFILRKLEFFNNFYSNFFICFLLDPTIYWREISSTNFLHNLVLIINTVFLELVKISKPLFLYLLILEIVLFFRVDSISMLDNNTKTIIILFFLHNQTLHILNFQRNCAFLFTKY